MGAVQAGGEPDTGAGLFKFTDKLARDSRPAGGRAHKPGRITTESPGNNLELLDLIPMNSCGPLISASSVSLLTSDQSGAFLRAAIVY